MYNTWMELLAGTKCALEVEKTRWSSYTLEFGTGNKMYGARVKARAKRTLNSESKLVCYAVCHLGTAFVVKNRIKYFMFVGIRPPMLEGSWSYSLFVKEEYEQNDVLDMENLVIVDEGLYEMWRTKEMLNNL